MGVGASHEEKADGQPTSGCAVASWAGIVSILPGALPILCLTMPGGRLPVKGCCRHLLMEPLLTTCFFAGHRVYKDE